MIFWKLFVTFFKIGLFNFGGGYAMISFIQNEVVYKQAWLTTSEFTDVVAISQITPGPVGINLATYTGYTAAHSVWGSVIATFAVCLPSFILMLLVSRYFLKYRHAQAVENVFKGLRPAVIGLIAAAALVLCNGENFVDYKSVLLFLSAFIAVGKFKAGPIAVIFACGVLSFIFY